MYADEKAQLIANSRLAGGDAVKESRPLLSVINEHGEQLDKLSGLVSSLEDRLHSIRSSVISADNIDVVPQRTGSSVFNQVTEQTNSVKSLQYRLNSLLEELEI